MSPVTGAFITFEGGEGAGKSTQLRLVAEALRQKGHDVLTTREPGGSPGAEALRTLLLFGEAELSPRAEIMTHFAARCDHIDRVIVPALNAGRIVLCDRFSDSTMAYQGYGRAGGEADTLEMIRDLQKLIKISPDLTLLFSASPEVARKRLEGRGGATDRYETAGLAFHERVRHGFEQISAQSPARFRYIETDGRAIPEVTEIAAEMILTFLRTR